MAQFNFEQHPGKNLSMDASNLSSEELTVVRRIMNDNRTTSPNYIKKNACGAFLQGCVEPHGDENDGWMMIEFWKMDYNAIRDFYKYVNTALEKLQKTETKENT